MRNEFTETLLQGAYDRSQMDPRDRRFVQEMVYGVVRNLRMIDWLIRDYNNEDKLQPEVRHLLRIGIYQLLWMDRVPDHAALNETVGLSRKFGVGHKSALINGIMREVQRSREQIAKTIETMKDEKPGSAFSMPDWLIRHWERQLSKEDLRAFLEWNNQASVNYARVNTLKIQPEDLERKWETERVEFERFDAPWAKDMVIYRFKGGSHLPSLPSFRSGGFYVQDASTLASVQLLAPQPGELLLDLCSAPGGKTAAIADLMKNEGQLIATDSNSDRLEMVTENCERLGITNVALHGNISSPFSKLTSKRFDKILIDAPCSNTGVMQRRVDLRWRINNTEIEVLKETQLSLLRQVANRVKPGGKIVYSTCSIETGENQEIVEAFCKEVPSFKMIEEVQLTPWKDKVDGAYAALLEFQA